MKTPDSEVIPITSGRIQRVSLSFQLKDRRGVNKNGWNANRLGRLPVNGMGIHECPLMKRWFIFLAVENLSG